PAPSRARFTGAGTVMVTRGANDLRFLRIREPRATLRALPLRLVAVEACEQRRQLRDDVRDVGELLVQLVATLLAVPLEAVVLARFALLLDDKPDGVRRAPRRVRHPGRQEKDFALADRNVHDLPPVQHLQDD